MSLKHLVQELVQKKTYYNERSSLLTHTRLSKKGIILSLLPGLSLPLILLLWAASQTPSGLIPFFLGLISFFPLSVTYLIYLIVRLNHLPQSDPAAPWCKRIALVAGLGIAGISLLLTFTSLLASLSFGREFLLSVVSLLLSIAGFIFLALPIILPIMEIWLYHKMQNYRNR